MGIGGMVLVRTVLVRTNHKLSGNRLEVKKNSLVLARSCSYYSGPTVDPGHPWIPGWPACHSSTSTDGLGHPRILPFLAYIKATT